MSAGDLNIPTGDALNLRWAFRRTYGALWPVVVRLAVGALVCVGVYRETGICTAGVALLAMLALEWAPVMTELRVLKVEVDLETLRLQLGGRSE